MKTVDGIMDSIRRIYQEDRYFSYSSMEKSCAVTEDLMRGNGLTEIRTLHFDADGKKDHGGWLMPPGWLAKQATLHIVLPDGKEELVCSYADNPCSLMLYSRSAEVTAELVLAGAEDLAGKIVWFSDHFPAMEDSVECFRRGALGILSSCLVGPYAGKSEFKYLDDSCQWCNYQIPFWQFDGSPFGFSLTPNQGKHLNELLHEHGCLRLHAAVQAGIAAGKLPAVTGLLPGKTKQEILITAHLFEQGANDNASGVAEALAVVKALSRRERKRGIRLLFTHEIKSLQAYANEVSPIPEWVAGINLDMVGVSLDRRASIGDSAPAFPNFVPPLLCRMLKRHGCSAGIRAISGLDATFSDTDFQVPMTFLEFPADPNYHKSSDTPDRIDVDFLDLTYKIADDFVSYLINAGLPETEELAEMVCDYDFQRTLKQGETMEMAREIAHRRLDSILKLASTSAEKAEMQTLLRPWHERIESHYSVSDGSGREELPVELAEKLRDLVPVKKYHGFFSLEKYWLHGEINPQLAPLMHGWAAPPWVEYAMMWSDSSRTAEKIWYLLRDSGYRCDPRLFLDFLHFMTREKYVEMRTGGKN